MSTRKISAELLHPELNFSASRSGGPGGQNVNKVNSKITLRLDIANSTILSADEKAILLDKLASRLTADGELILIAQDKRSQLQNKESAIVKLEQLLTKAFTKRKARKATKPSKSSVRERIKKKKQQSEKKQWRQKPF
jgi:ribosome-associated protein